MPEREFTAEAQSTLSKEFLINKYFELDELRVSTVKRGDFGLLTTKVAKDTKIGYRIMKKRRIFKKAFSSFVLFVCFVVMTVSPNSANSASLW